MVKRLLGYIKITQRGVKNHYQVLCILQFQWGLCQAQPHRLINPNNIPVQFVMYKHLLFLRIYFVNISTVKFVWLRLLWY